MEIQVIEKTNGRINRVTGTTIKERLSVDLQIKLYTYYQIKKATNLWILKLIVWFAEYLIQPFQIILYK